MSEFTLNDVSASAGAQVTISAADSATSLTAAQLAGIKGVVSGAWTAPAPTGDSLIDFNVLRAFASAIPAGAVVNFPQGATYTLAAGWQTIKSGQRWIGNRATIKRASQVVATTTTPVLSGTTYIGLSSVAGQYIGKFVSLFGNNGSAAACRYNYITRITGVDANGIFVDALLNSVIRVSDSVNGQTIVAGATLHDAGWQLGNNYDAVRAYTSWGGTEANFWNTQLPSDVLIQDLILDGNVSNFATGQRWETLQELATVAHDVKLYGLQLVNCAGEGLLLSGKKIQIDRLSASVINGNPIHLSAFSASYGCHDVLCTMPNLDTFCQVDIGHSDGGFIASNNVYGAKIRDGIMRNSPKAGLGSWNSVDNQGLDASGITFENLVGGAWTAKTASSANIQLLDFSIVGNTVKNCGQSIIGGDYSQGSNNSTAKNFKCNRNTFYDATLFATSFIGGEIIGNEAWMTTAHAMFTPSASVIPNGNVFDFPSHQGTEIAGNRVTMPSFIGGAVNANGSSCGINVYGQSVDVLKDVRYHDNYTFGGMVGQTVQAGQGGVIPHNNESVDAGFIGIYFSIGSLQKTMQAHHNNARISTANSIMNSVGLSGGHQAIQYSNGSTTAWLLADANTVQVDAQTGGTYVIGHKINSGRVKGSRNHAQMYTANSRPWEFSGGITGSPVTNVGYWEDATTNVTPSGAGTPAGETLTNLRTLP